MNFVKIIAAANPTTTTTLPIIIIIGIASFILSVCDCLSDMYEEEAELVCEAISSDDEAALETDEFEETEALLCTTDSVSLDELDVSEDDEAESSDETGSCPEEATELIELIELAELMTTGLVELDEIEDLEDFEDFKELDEASGVEPKDELCWGILLEELETLEAVEAIELDELAEADEADELPELPGFSALDEAAEPDASAVFVEEEAIGLLDKLDEADELEAAELSAGFSADEAADDEEELSCGAELSVGCCTESVGALSEELAASEDAVGDGAISNGKSEEVFAVSAAAQRLTTLSAVIAEKITVSIRLFFMGISFVKTDFSSADLRLVFVPKIAPAITECRQTSFGAFAFLARPALTAVFAKSRRCPPKGAQG